LALATRERPDLTPAGAPITRARITSRRRRRSACSPWPGTLESLSVAPLGVTGAIFEGSSL
jgi:hypothetical protein